MATKRINNIKELKETYKNNCRKKDFVVIGKTDAFAIVQDMYYLYDLNNKKLNKKLDKVLKEYEVNFFEQIYLLQLDISKIPNEICELIKKMAHEKRNEHFGKEAIKKNRLLDELKEF